VHGALGRSLLALFLGWMAFSAVYLDHHWVIDVIGGATFAFATAFLVARAPSLFPARMRTAPAIAGATEPRTLASRSEVGLR
jgi:membrane-associated phospholipid phosphatase